MPIYEYRCTSCDHLMEVFAKMSDPPPLACESCGAATLEKVLHPVAVHYKGSGFYATDYGSKRSGGADKGASAAEPAGGSSSGKADGGSGGDSGGKSGDSGSGSSGSGGGDSSGGSSKPKSSGDAG